MCTNIELGGATLAIYEDPVKARDSHHNLLSIFTGKERDLSHNSAVESLHPKRQGSLVD